MIPKKETGLDTYWLTAADEDDDIDESEFIRPYGLCLSKNRSGSSNRMNIFHYDFIVHSNEIKSH